MGEKLKRMAGSIVVGLVAAYLCWPHIFPPQPLLDLDGGGEKTVAIAKLVPTDPGAAPTRNPFRQVVDADPDASEDATTAEVTELESEVSETTIVDSLKLNATLVRSPNPAAIILGHMYSPGEAIDLPSQPSTPIVVSQIDNDRVLLRHGQKVIELTYDGAEVVVDAVPATDAAAGKLGVLSTLRSWLSGGNTHSMTRQTKP